MKPDIKEALAAAISNLEKKTGKTSIRKVTEVDLGHLPPAQISAKEAQKIKDGDLGRHSQNNNPWMYSSK